MTANIRQTGASGFPAEYLPYSCDNFTVNFSSRLVPISSEPAIAYIEFIGATTHAELLINHRRFGHRHFDTKIALVTPDNYVDGSYKSVLLTDHLRRNKYAHNGIDSLDELFEIFQSSDYYTLQTIHSLSHIYDALYMYEKTDQRFIDTIEMLNMYLALISDERELNCLVNYLNINAGDFLETNPDGQYAIPYTINALALDTKKQQYNDECASDSLLLSFEENICNDTRDAPTSYTDKLPNT
jgi:hypothetical protein